MEYTEQVLAWMRLCMLEEPDGFNGAEYYPNRVPLFDALSKDWGAEEMIGFSGQDLLDILTTRYDVDVGSKEYQRGYRIVWRLLIQSSTQKITRGIDILKDVALVILLDMKENEGKDIARGTFAELLRYGSVHFQQERKAIKYIKAEKPTRTIKQGLLEP